MGLAVQGDRDDWHPTSAGRAVLKGGGVVSAVKLTEAQRVALEQLGNSIIGAYARDALQSAVWDQLCTIGLATCHRSSIGEVAERAAYYTTDAGRAALKGGAS